MPLFKPRIKGDKNVKIESSMTLRDFVAEVGSIEFETSDTQYALVFTEREGFTLNEITKEDAIIEERVYQSPVWGYVFNRIMEIISIEERKGK